MYRRATHAWEKANRALAEDWHYNLEFDRCEHGMQPAAMHSGCLVPLRRAEHCTLHACPLPAGLQCSVVVSLHIMQQPSSPCSLFWPPIQ